MSDEQEEVQETNGSAQPFLFDEFSYDWRKEWKGMPSYEHGDLTPIKSIMLHFKTQADVDSFALAVKKPMNDETKYAWWPEMEIETTRDKMYVCDNPELRTPRYPIYIISKGRWESRLTARELERINVPYRIVVEPQEFDNYAAVIDPKKILVLPFSNLGKGSIPARNWVWDHAMEEEHERHWIFDDNISKFYRYEWNLKCPVGDGAIFRAAEDFVDRYENIAMAGLQYEMFVSRKDVQPPYLLNTRVYSMILLKNDLLMRWRGRYNEDTDLSIRILKAGWCTILFNAFLGKKITTMKMKGGNTDELYKGAEANADLWAAHVSSCNQCKLEESPRCKAGREILSKDGRWLMADSLVQQHPEITEITRKFGRWQHQVNYRKFKANKLILKPGVEVSDEVNDYGMSRIVLKKPIEEPEEDQALQATEVNLEIKNAQ
jgi:hypothetical protein